MRHNLLLLVFGVVRFFNASTLLLFGEIQAKTFNKHFANLARTGLEIAALAVLGIELKAQRKLLCNLGVNLALAKLVQAPEHIAILKVAVVALDGLVQDGPSLARTLQKLYKKKVGDSSASMPTAPTEPSDGNEETASKDYADYIINLAGDEWDSEKGTWKDAGGTYAKAFADDAFTADSATYKQAMTAYYTAYQQYSSQASSASSKWTEYANGLYAKANISIYGLFA